MSVLVWIEQYKGHVPNVSWEVLGKAKEFAGALDGTLAAVVAGDNVAAVAQEAFAYGADKVYAYESAELADFRVEPYAKVVSDAAKTAGATIVLAGGTTRGRDLAAYVATLNGWGIAPDATGLSLVDGKLVARREVYTGNILADVTFHSDVQVASVRGRSFSLPEKDGGKQGELISGDAAVAEGAAKSVVEGVSEKESGEVSLTDANIVVSGGRGVKGPEGFAPIRELAAVLGAAVGASRAAVDAGWIPYDHQVGQTGKTVRPDLYIANGISGAIQHLAGMGSSKVIVAINKDPDAPIFQVANYGIVGDLFTYVPALTAELKKRG